MADENELLGMYALIKKVKRWRPEKNNSNSHKFFYIDGAQNVLAKYAKYPVILPVVADELTKSRSISLFTLSPAYISQQYT